MTQHFIDEIDAVGRMSDRYMVEGTTVRRWDPIAGYYTRHHGLTEEQVEHLLAAAESGRMSVTLSAEAERAARREGWSRPGARLHLAWGEEVRS